VFHDPFCLSSKGGKQSDQANAIDKILDKMLNVYVLLTKDARTSLQHKQPSATSMKPTHAAACGEAGVSGWTLIWLSVVNKKKVLLSTFCKRLCNTYIPEHMPGQNLV
jgi:hypothetical protein